MDSQHTPEPWSVNDWTQPDREISIGAVGTPLIAKVMMRDVSVNEHKANARRIVACVNACAGLSTDELESKPAGIVASTIDASVGLIGFASEMAVDYRQQRDELAESLTDILARFESCISGGNGQLEDDAPAIAKAKAALLNAKR